MSYLLDTNTCIRYLNGQSENVEERLERLTPDGVVFCSVVKAELLCGAAKSTAGERTFIRFFSLFNSLPLDDRSVARFSASLLELHNESAPGVQVAV